MDGPFFVRCLQRIGDLSRNRQRSGGLKASRYLVLVAYPVPMIDLVPMIDPVPVIDAVPVAGDLQVSGSVSSVNAFVI